VRCGPCERSDAHHAAHRYAGAWALHVRVQLTAEPALAAAAAAAARGVVRPPDDVLLEYIDQQLALRGPRNAVPAVVAAMLKLLRLDVRHPGAAERLVQAFHRALPRALQRLRDETARNTGWPLGGHRLRENGSEGT
jgi:hypothetical protein